MNLFLPPQRVTRLQVISAVAFPMILLLIPAEALPEMAAHDWQLSLLLSSFPVTTIAGGISAWRFYRKLGRAEIDPMHVRAWWGMVASLLAVVICLAFRPAVLVWAFLGLTLSGGAVLGFHAYWAVVESGSESR